MHSPVIIIRQLVTSQFKSIYFQIFCKNYCRKTTEATIMKIVSNETKLIYAINIFILATWCLLLSYGNHLNIKMSFFNDVNVSVNGNGHNHFKIIQPENQKCNYFMFLLYIAIFYLIFTLVSNVKLHPLTFVMVILFQKKKKKKIRVELHCFKPRHYQMANSYAPCTWHLTEVQVRLCRCAN